MNATLAKYTDTRAWFRGLLKNCIHSGTGAVIAAFGTNGVEQMTPESLAHYTQGIGLSFQQAVAVFLVTAFLAALRFVNASTEETTPPIP
jgi:hypothetical protein